MDDGQRRRKVRNNIALEKLKSCAGLKINQGHDVSFVNIIFHFWTNTFVPLETLRRTRLYLLKASQLCPRILQLKNPMFFLTPPNKHNFSLPSNLISLSCHCRCDASHFSSNQAVIKLLKLFFRSWHWPIIFWSDNILPNGHPGGIQVTQVVPRCSQTWRQVD